MNESEKIDLLNKLVDSLFGPIEMNFLAKYSAPFDITRPNIHDSKKEFARELGTVLAIRDHLKDMLDLLIATTTEAENDPLHQAMVRRLSFAIEANVSQRSKRLNPESASELALKNLKDTGFYYNSIYVVIEMLRSFEQRLRDLKEQESEFWSVAYRAPNYYARTIALRFARLFASRTGKRPTFGISSEGSHPSTDFGRALEQVFDILEIGANVRKAAEWALAQLTEQDWKPKLNALAYPSGGFPKFGDISLSRNDPKTGIARLLLEKGD